MGTEARVTGEMSEHELGDGRVVRFTMRVVNPDGTIRAEVVEDVMMPPDGWTRTSAFEVRLAVKERLKTRLQEHSSPDPGTEPAGRG